MWSLESAEKYFTTAYCEYRPDKETPPPPPPLPVFPPKPDKNSLLEGVQPASMRLLVR